MKTEQDSRGGENPTRQLSLRRKQSGRAPLATAAGEAPDVKGSCKRVSERAGPNMSEHRASLEKGNATADPVGIRGRLAGRGTRAKRAPRPCRRGSGEDMRATETCGNTGNPTRREVKAPSQQPARARLGCGGWRRGPYERRSRVMPVEQRSLSSRTMTEAGKARRLARAYKLHRGFGTFSSHHRPKRRQILAVGENLSALSESRMRENRPSGLMSGEWKRSA